METSKLILCPTDFSQGSARAVELAAGLAQALSARLELLHVYHIPVAALPNAAMTNWPSHIKPITESARKALDELQAPLKARGLNVSTRLMEGQPAAAIVKHATEPGTVMVVLGTHGHSGLRRALLGSTAERVVRTASVPVLTVQLEQPTKGVA